MKREKESIWENENYFYSRFQDDYGWRAYIEDKKSDFYILSGPWKRKYKATNQIDLWME